MSQTSRRAVKRSEPKLSPLMSTLMSPMRSSPPPTKTQSKSSTRKTSSKATTRRTTTTTRRRRSTTTPTETALAPFPPPTAKNGSGIDPGRESMKVSGAALRNLIDLFFFPQLFLKLPFFVF